MRRTLASTILTTALCLSAVQGAEPQNAMPPALIEAIAGHEPYHSLVELGLPLINTTAEVEALPADLRRRRSTGIKLALLGQMVQARAERHRITEENYAATARRARELGAPASFALYMKLLADGQLSSRERYTVREALNCLYRDYRVNVLELRLFVETSDLDDADLLAMGDWLPVAALFNLAKPGDVTEPELAQQYGEQGVLTTELAAVYAAIQSPEQAESAVAQLLPLLQRYAATLPLRELVSPAQLQQLQARYGLLYGAVPQLNAQRERVRRANYYDSVKLRIIDTLLN